MKYPGQQFKPPQELIDSGETEGEAMITWKKVGDRYTITSIDSMEIQEEPREMTSDEEIDETFSEGMM